MTKFQQYTPHAATEQLMSEAPGTSQKGGGRREFRYTKEMCDCSLCAERPCPGVAHCPYFDEYLEAGAWGPCHLLLHWLARLDDQELRRRIRRLCLVDDYRLYRDDEHKQRLRRLEKQGILHRKQRNHTAALFLLSASDDLWQRCPSALRGGEISFYHIDLTGLSAEDELLRWAARALYYGYTHKLLAELCNRETGDSLVRLFAAALLVYEYGLPEFGKGSATQC